MEFLIYLILGYLGFSAAYYFVFAAASRLVKHSDVKQVSLKGLNKIAVMIPGYKEDAVIVESAKKALEQNYPSNLYKVFVIADSMKAETIDALNQLDVEVLEVSFEKSTKAKAINEAYRRISEPFDINVVLDADNIMEADFLKKVNEAYNNGYKVMQGHRVAKNKENGLATLDAVSEEINNNIFRKGHRVLRLSSALIGSGMAFDFELFKSEMAQIDAIGGFDKELELSLLKQGFKIAYQENALVYDEKVSREEAFTNQRTRWIAAQIRYGMKSFGPALLHLITRGNADYFDKSLQFLLPPRLILLGGLTLITAVFSVFQLPLWTWFVGFWSIMILGLALAVPSGFYNKSTLKAAAGLPKTFWLMIKALAGFKKAKNNFLHTPHQSVS